MKEAQCIVGNLCGSSTKEATDFVSGFWVLSQHAGRQDEHLPEGRCPGLDLQHLYLPPRLISKVIHPPIMLPADRVCGLTPTRSHPA